MAAGCQDLAAGQSWRVALRKERHGNLYRQPGNSTGEEMSDLMLGYLVIPGEVNIAKSKRDNPESEAPDRPKGQRKGWSKVGWLGGWERG